MTEVSTAAPETVPVTSRTVACDGGDGALGHPRVYLNMGNHPSVECPYCDRMFVLDGEVSNDHH